MPLNEFEAREYVGLTGTEWRTLLQVAVYGMRAMAKDCQRNVDIQTVIDCGAVVRKLQDSVPKEPAPPPETAEAFAASIPDEQFSDVE